MRHEVTYFFYEDEIFLELRSHGIHVSRELMYSIEETLTNPHGVTEEDVIREAIRAGADAGAKPQDVAEILLKLAEISVYIPLEVQKCPA